MAEITLANLNAMPAIDAFAVMRKLCGAAAWCEAMSKARPFASNAYVHLAADRAFDELRESDWREAFAAHPKIGDVNSLRMKFAGNHEWSDGEQSGVQAASEEIFAELSQLNAEYEAKYGFIFIVCATGKSALEMLELLRGRMHHSSEGELEIAAAEQRKITHLRIDKLLP